MRRRGVSLHRPRAVGFTLIELLVVIAIIAILAAIMFPVFTKARSTARAAACTSNLKQIGLAFRAYLDEWEAPCPSGEGYIIWKTPGPYGYSANAVAWTERLYHYSRKAEIFRCPARRVNFGYAYNPMASGLYGRYDDPGNRTSLGKAAPRRPAKLIIVYDAPGSGSGSIAPAGPNVFPTGNADQTNEGQLEGQVYGPYGATRLNPNEDFESYQWLTPNPALIRANNERYQYHSLMFFPGPHNGNLNVLYYDGHVKSSNDWRMGQMFFRP